MTARNTADLTDETDRRRLADDLAADGGAEWAADFRPGSLGCHELLDRTALIADLVEGRLVEHPACVANPAWFALARRAAAALYELYQQVGTAHSDDTT